MKTRIVVVILILVVLGYRLSSTSRSSFAIAEKNFSFGAIIDTGVVSHVFKIHNTGDDSLVISDIHASCGCTATVLDKKVVAPGDAANLKVTFDPKGKAVGKVDKKIWITSSAGKDSLEISADIKAMHPEMMAMTVKNIFTGDCRTCHVDKGVGKLGMALFDADCLMCHASSPKAHAPHLGKLMALNAPDTTLYRIIAEGRPGKNMPAYATAHGGPLTDEEIKSLVALIQLDHNRKK